MNKNKPLYILKIGGSVITRKDRSGISIKSSVRFALVKKIAEIIKKTIEKNNISLILIHGAGSIGHQLAHKYKLRDGTKNDRNKLKSSVLLQNTNQKFDNAIIRIFIDIGLDVTPIHTASVIIQKNKKIFNFHLKTIEEALKNDCIPILYGEMVFDNDLGMTVCSGDAIAAYLARKFKIKKILFASDINGIFDKDPHLYEDAKLIKKINLKKVEQNIKLSESHNIDVTDGLKGKINEFKKISNHSLESIEIFNGLVEKNYENALLGKKFNHTTIKI